MKIAVAGVVSKKIIPYALGGTEVFTYLLVNELVKRGHEVTLYCAKGSQTKAQNQIEICEADEAMGIESNIEMVYPYTLLEVRQILADIKKKKFDLLHVNFLKTFMLSFFADQINIPILYTLHREFFSNPKIFNAYSRMGFCSNENFVFVSKSEQEKSLFKGKTSYIYNGINVNNYVYSPQERSEELFWLSRIDPTKGPKEAILASSAAGKRLRLVGDIDRKKNQEYFEQELEPLLSDTIIYEKPTDFERNLELYQKAKAFLFPIAWEEPFGLVMVEAMSCGTPVIAFARGAAPELIKDGVTGFVINSSENDFRGDWIVKKTGIDGLKEAIERIYSMPKDEYQKMSYACRKHVKENFSVEIMVGNYIKLYREIIGESKLF